MPRVWGRTWLKLTGHTVAAMAGPDSLLHSLCLVYVGVEGGQLPPGTSPVLCVLQKPAHSPPPLGMALPSHTAPGDSKRLWPQAWRTVAVHRTPGDRSWDSGVPAGGRAVPGEEKEEQGPLASQPQATDWTVSLSQHGASCLRVRTSGASFPRPGPSGGKSWACRDPAGASQGGLRPWVGPGAPRARARVWHLHYPH